MPLSLPSRLVVAALSVACLASVRAEDGANTLGIPPKLEELVIKAASASDAARAAALGEFLSGLEKATDLDPKVKLAALWQANLVAQDQDSKEKIIALGGTVGLPETLMMLEYYHFDATLAKNIASATSALKKLVPALGNKKDAIDRTASEQWEDPLGFNARWSDGTAVLDVIQYPLTTFQGALTTEEGGKRITLLGVLGTDKALHLYGPDITGTLTKDGGKLTISGKEIALVRTPVGKIGTIPKPEGAQVLFDGKGFDQFPGLGWKILPDGAMQSVPRGGGAPKTKDKYGDVRLYLEFREPFNPECVLQYRGNSGVILMGSYEVQVLDSFGLVSQPNDCGAVYSISAPKVNASAPPLEWQSYVIEFHAPKFDASGTKTQNAKFTVWQNGIKIQDNVEAPRLTGAAHTPGGKPSRPEPNGPASLSLQDHGNTVQYRNIWIEPLKE